METTTMICSAIIGMVIGYRLKPEPTVYEIAKELKEKREKQNK